jgi:hypothetical protein
MENAKGEIEALHFTLCKLHFEWNAQVNGVEAGPSSSTNLPRVRGER